MQDSLAKPKNVIMRFSAPRPQECKSVLAKLADAPRKLHSSYEKRIAFYKFVALLSLSLVGATIAYIVYKRFLYTESDVYWIVGISVLVPLYFYANYLLFKRANARYTSFKRARKLYENGTATIGYVNMLNIYRNGEYQNYFLENIQGISNSAFLRVDYQFLVDDKCCVGSKLVKLRTACELSINDPIVVLYDPELPTESMLFPIPKSEFSTTFFRGKEQNTELEEKPL
ncbi:MAG: hypothetical protein WC966_01000 [Bradymonadales bacterium]|jgi:hypothetical protein